MCRRPLPRPRRQIPEAASQLDDLRRTAAGQLPRGGVAREIQRCPQPRDDLRRYRSGMTRRPAHTVIVKDVGEREWQVLRSGQRILDRGVELGFCNRRRDRDRDVTQQAHPPLAQHALGLFRHDAQVAGDRAAVVRDGAIRERVVGLFLIARALEEQLELVVPGRAPGPQHAVDARPDVGPDLRPDFARRPAEGPWVLGAERHRAVGVVVKECQIRSPAHPHRKTRRQEHPDNRAQALRPGFSRSERGRRPVGGAHEGRHFAFDGEGIVLGSGVQRSSASQRPQ